MLTGAPSEAEAGKFKFSYKSGPFHVGVSHGHTWNHGRHVVHTVPVAPVCRSWRIVHERVVKIVDVARGEGIETIAYANTEEG